MDFYSILQEILSEKGLSIPEAARACGLSDSTLRSIITRKNKTVALEVAMKISKGLCVSLERLNGMKELGPKNNAMHPDEEKLLKDFRSLNSEGKKYIPIIITMIFYRDAYGNSDSANNRTRRNHLSCKKNNYKQSQKN